MEYVKWRRKYISIMPNAGRTSAHVLEIIIPFGSGSGTVYLKTWWLISMVAFSYILCIRLTRLVVNVIVNRIDIQEMSAQRSVVQYAMILVFTHWGRDKMATIFQTTFSNVFSFIERFVFWFELHWSLFQRVLFTINRQWFRYWLSAGQATSHDLNVRRDHWSMDAELGGDE